jgi:hypothetical protein
VLVPPWTARVRLQDAPLPSPACSRRHLPLKGRNVCRHRPNEATLAWGAVNKAHPFGVAACRWIPLGRWQIIALGYSTRQRGQGGYGSARLSAAAKWREKVAVRWWLSFLVMNPSTIASQIGRRGQTKRSMSIETTLGSVASSR